MEARTLFDSHGQAKPIESFVQQHFGSVHLNEIDDVVHGVTHAVAPVVHAAAPLGNALIKGARHEVIRAGYVLHSLNTLWREIQNKIYTSGTHSPWHPGTLSTS